MFSSKNNNKSDENISIEQIKSTPKQEITSSTSKQVKHKEGQDFPQIEMPKDMGNYDNFK